MRSSMEAFDQVVEEKKTLDELSSINENDQNLGPN